MATGSNSIWDELDDVMFGSGTAPKPTVPRPGATASTSTPVNALASFLGGSGSAIKQVSKETPEYGKIEVDKARANAAQRILNDPVAKASGPDFMIKELNKIASGERRDTGGGILGAISGGVGQFLQGVGYGLERPLAAVTSIAKEISDIPNGGFSVEDLVKQAIAKDTAPSKYIPKTGNDWIDKSIGFVTDVALDPLTYVTFGASQFAGRAGRLNLSTLAAQADNIAKAPSLLKKVENGSIARLGEWALDANERAVLGLRPGLSWTFGKGGVIGREGTKLAKGSELAATAVGKPLANIRGGLSQTGLFTPFQKVLTPRTVKLANLTMYGRIADDPETVNRVADLASFSAAKRANAAGTLVQKRFGSEGQKLVKEIADYEAATGRRIFEVRENVRPAVDATEQDLVNRMTSFLDNMREYANTTTNEFANRRNVEAFGINHRENYVPHTLTPESRKFVASKKWQGGANAKTIQQMLGMSGSEFAKGPGVLRGRTLQQGQRWLGKELKSNVGDGAASIAEINFVSESVLGFKWFEEDGAQYLSNYLDSIVNQTKRVNFVDRLFDFGGDAVKKLNLTREPNKKLARQVAKIIDGYDNIMAPVLKQLADEQSDVDFIFGPRLELARRLLELKPGERMFTPKQVNEMTEILDATFGELENGLRLATSSDSGIEYAYINLLSGLERNLKAAKSALELVDEEELIGRLGLREMYQRMFPDAEIPKDFRTMAEDLLDGAEIYFADRYKKMYRGEDPRRVVEQFGKGSSTRDPDVIISNFTKDEKEFIGGTYDSYGDYYPQDYIAAAADLKKLTEFVQQNAKPNESQVFRGAAEDPIIQLFANKELPGKLLSFSFNPEEAENFARPGFYSYEPGELRGLDLNKLNLTIRPDEEEFLVDPWSIVDATAKRLNPEYAKMAKKNLKEAKKIFEEKTAERDAASGVRRMLDSKNRAEKARAIQQSVGALNEEIKNINLKRDADILGLDPADPAVKKINRSASAQVGARTKKINELKSRMDVVGALLAETDAWNQIEQVYGKDLEKITRLLKNSPPPGAAGEASALWAEQTFKTMKSLEGYGMVMQPAERDLMRKVITQMKGLEAKLATLEAERAIPLEMYNKIASGELLPKISSDVIKGWEAIESLGVQMPPEIRERMFAKVQQLGTPEGASRFRKMYDSYTRFFKVTAMLSPGFIARNAYTAAFNNFVAGVSVAETKEAMKFATNMLRHGVDKALGMVPDASRDLYEQALKVTYATGAGQTYDDILAPVLAGKGARWINSKPVKLWSNLNETTEIAFRFALGLSSLNRGMDFDAAAGVVARYHFDYTDVSSLDEFARKMIPFWIFASRNIPLQITNQIARPSAYRMYESVERNYGLSEEDQAGLPSWLRERGPIQFPGMGANSMLLPDLPQLDMEEQIRMMSDPMRLLSQANPLIKLPIELMGDRQLWNAVPFSDKPSQVRGPLDFPAYAIDALLGRANKNPRTGEYTTSSKTAYALPNLIPTLGQAQRLFPWLGGKSEYQDRASSSIAGYFGLPYRRVGQEEQFNEQQRRQFAIRDYLSGLTRSGQIMPKE